MATISYYVINPDGSRTLVTETLAPETVNQQSLVAKAQTALTNNATYLALAAPSTAQNTAQVQALTRECNALIRLLLNLFDTTAGT